MTTRILPAVGDADAARSVTTLLSQLPDAEPATPATNSTSLLDTLARLAGESLDELPEVVLVHERIGPLPALELVREVALRFPAVGVVLITADAGAELYSAAMDSGARGLVGLPLSYDDLATRVQAAAQWSVGVRRHLGGGGDEFTGPGGTVVTVSGAKGGVGTTVTAVQLALAARASGLSVALVDLDLQSGDVASYLDVQFRRSIVDLAGIHDISPRVLQDALYTHPTGLGLLLAPGDGERGEEVNDRASRQIISALRNRYEVVVIDCGTQMNGANAAAVEMADTALLVTTPDVVAVRAAKRLVRLWDRLQIRKVEETVTLLNRHTRNTEIQPSLVEKITGTRVARICVPSNFKELQPAVDSGRMQDLDSRGAVKQALWSLAGELGLVKAKAKEGAALERTGKFWNDRGSIGIRPRRAPAGDAQGAPPPGVAGAAQPAGTAAPAGTARAAQPPGAPGAAGAAQLGDPRRGDSGQVSIEFLGMVPLIVLTLVLVWQFVLVGYTFTLAGNSADEAARSAAAAEPYERRPACEEAGKKDLPDAWQGSAQVDCDTANQLVEATVDLEVPLLFPGGVDFPFPGITGHAGAVEEG